MPEAIKLSNGRVLTKFQEDDYTYTQSFLPINSGATGNAVINIEADSHFKWTRAVYYATIANAAFTVTTQPMPNVTIQVTDSGSGRQVFQNPVPIPSYFGNNASLPFILPVPRIFMANTSMQIQVVNFDAAVNYNLYLAFIGTKIFTPGLNG